MLKEESCRFPERRRTPRTHPPSDPDAAYPYLVVNIGSGVSIMKVDGPSPIRPLSRRLGGTLGIVGVRGARAFEVWGWRVLGVTLRACRCRPLVSPARVQRALPVLHLAMRAGPTV